MEQLKNLIGPQVLTTAIVITAIYSLQVLIGFTILIAPALLDVSGITRPPSKCMHWTVGFYETVKS